MRSELYQQLLFALFAILTTTSDLTSDIYLTQDLAYGHRLGLSQLQQQRLSL